MTPEVPKLPASIKNYGKVEPYPPEPEQVFEPEQPLTYDQVLTRAVVKPLRLGHHAVRNERGKSVPVEAGKGKELKRPLPREIPVAVLTDMKDPDVHGTDTVRLSAPLADWVGGTETNTTLRNPDISPRLKRDIRNRRRSARRIIA